MPTFGKACGAILLAGLAFVVTGMIAPHLPVTMTRAPAWLIVVAFGLLVGWSMGGDRRAGLGAAAGRGVTAAVVLAIWSLLFGAVWEMLRRSSRGIYDGPMDALGDVADLMAVYGRLLLDPTVAAVLLAGGALAGLLSGAVAKRWS